MVGTPARLLSSIVVPSCIALCIVISAALASGGLPSNMFVSNTVLTSPAGNPSHTHLFGAREANSVSYPGSVVTTVRVGTWPYGIAVDAANDSVYVPNLDNTNVSIINGSTNTIAESVNLPSSPFIATYDPLHRDVYVSSSNDPEEVISGPTILASIALPNEAGSGVFDPADSELYLADSVGQTGPQPVCVLSGTTLVQCVVAGDEPQALAYDYADGDVYVTNWGTNNITLFHGVSVVGSVNIGTGPSSIVYDNGTGQVYVTNYNTDNVSVLSGTSLVGTINVGSEPSFSAYDPGNGYVYVTNVQSNNVTVIDGQTVVATIPVGTNPQGPIYDSQNGDIYVPNYNSDNVSVINGTSVVANLPVGAGPQTIAYDSDNGDVYVPNYHSGTVTVLNGSVVYPTLHSFSATPNIIVVGASVDFVVSASINIGSLAYTYTELPPGCVSSDVPSLVCTPTRVGLYTVQVQVDEGAGGGVAATTTVTVKLFPISSFIATPSNIVDGASTNFTVSASGGVGPLNYAYSGLPPGCATADTDRLACSPIQVSNYTVTVYVNDTAGNSNNTTTYLNVGFYSVTLAATPSIVDIGTNVTLNTTVSGGPSLDIVDYSYAGLPLGCTNLNLEVFTCAPDQTGTFSIRVYAVDSGGDDVNATAMLSVNPVPVVNLSASATDALSPTSLSANVSGGTGPYHFTWLFGDGARASGQTVLHAFEVPGNYTVRAYANDTFGLSATNTILVTVYPALLVKLNVSSLTPLLGQTIAFVTNATGGVRPYNYTYSGFPPGCVSENKPAVGCLPTQADYYNITAHVRDQNNVIVNSTAQIHVIFDFNVVVPTNTSAGSPFTISVNTNETFSGGTAVLPLAGFGTFTYNYTGLPPGCASVDAASITCTPSQVGTYQITVSVHDEVGDHNSHTVVVHVVPAKPGSTTSGFLGLSGIAGYLLVGAIVAVLVVAVVLALFRFRKPKKGSDVVASPSTNQPIRNNQ
jgi:YVTN family beta-propeller protein